MAAKKQPTVRSLGELGEKAMLASLSMQNNLAAAQTQFDELMHDLNNTILNKDFPIYFFPGVVYPVRVLRMVGTLRIREKDPIVPLHHICVEFIVSGTMNGQDSPIMHVYVPVQELHKIRCCVAGQPVIA